MMPSPFPGIDPYLEAHWGDVHTRLITYASDALHGMLPGDLYSRVEEQVFVESDEDEEVKTRIPDVRVIEHRPPRVAREATATATLGPPEPVFVGLLHEPETQRFIEIRDASSGHRIVTVIEILSPTNKRPGRGRTAYLMKLDELQDSGVALLEIDLLREGKPTLLSQYCSPSQEKRTTYRACVWRPKNPYEVEVYPIALREPLPPIPVPLRETDPDVLLDLQSLLTQAYNNGNYALTTDYTYPPDPPLTAEDDDWAKQLRQK